jgi:hypothetical protein
MDRYWRCGRHNNERILKSPETGSGATSYPIRHLKSRHFIDLNADHQALPLQPTSFFGIVAGAAASAATAAVTQTAGKLISTMNMDRFRCLFIRSVSFEPMTQPEVVKGQLHHLSRALSGNIALHPA